MSDPSVRDELAAFVAERDWAQFHSPENLAKSIVIEAGELLECFQWSADADNERVRGELAYWEHEDPEEVVASGAARVMLGRAAG